MYNTTYLFSWLVAYCLSKTTIVKEKRVTEYVDKIVTEKVTVTKHDPFGLVKQDIEDLEEVIPKVHFKTGDTLADVAYKQGQKDVLTFLKRKHLGD